MRGIPWFRLWLPVTVAVLAIGLATGAVGYFQDQLHVPNASAIYVIAVVAVALVSGTIGAIATAIVSALVYNFLFTEPRYTFAIDDLGVWLSVILLLFIAIVVGQLVAVQRTQTAVARESAREARALFRVSRALATRTSTSDALREVADLLRDQTSMDRVWIALGSDDASERPVGGPSAEDRPPAPRLLHVMRRTPGDLPAEWVRVRAPAGALPSRTAGRARQSMATFRIRISASGVPLGSIWAIRPASAGVPDRMATRILAAAADQIGQALGHDRVRAEAQAAEIARQGDILKSALLQSVSHDLRTPLATIRAAAGSLRPPSPLSPEEQRESVEAIDREVEYLNRLVTNLLDLSRIEAGALKADRDAFVLDDLIERTLQRLGPRLEGRPLDVELTRQPVDVDPVFLDDVLTNLLENCVKYTEAAVGIRISARTLDDETVRLTVEDAGPGVPPDALDHLFEKFYRVPGAPRRSRAGTGIGLAVVRGLVEAMGGSVGARPSELGGLAIDIDLRAARAPADVADGSRS